MGIVTTGIPFHLSHVAILPPVLAEMAVANEKIGRKVRRERNWDHHRKAWFWYWLPKMANWRVCATLVFSQPQICSFGCFHQCYLLIEPKRRQRERMYDKYLLHATDRDWYKCGCCSSIVGELYMYTRACVTIIPLTKRSVDALLVCGVICCLFAPLSFLLWRRLFCKEVPVPCWDMWKLWTRSWWRISPET